MVDSKDIGNYIVYSDGRVWSKRKNKFLKPMLNNKTGYYTFGIDKKRIYHHRLIAKCFIPNPKNKKTINHKDGNKSNNNVNNLEWNTHSENHKHAFSNLYRKPNFNLNKNQTGQNNQNSKLKTKDVIYIKKSKEKVIDLANKYNVSASLISAIRNNRLWKHI